ncbi:hypothetical protein N7481_008164 [Penicillium waksmanii]|uniref:uncharacterized protein n=1 Tax=Penicillium waksmanii TaxID=69791 RepID=UPI002547A8B5|nr:uncharacterized protein N7481_008164 [Penicillium waksmanii]KAJ5980866.1 hypothetical protein N7481_008164 [Penicillium waksmanii]
MSEALQDTAAAAEERTGTSPVPSPPQAVVEQKPETQITATKDHDNDDQDTPEQEEDEEELENDDEEAKKEDTLAPPLPDEVPPPLPDEAPPGQGEDDGWEPVWDANSQAYYFFNRITGKSQWENPRVPTEEAPAAEEPSEKKAPMLGGYNPAIHGDYDPTASYAQQYEEQTQETGGPAADPTAAYAAAGTFNRFTGRWQAGSINPENHSQDNKSHRQMNAFFDVDAAANNHDGRSLRAERSAKKLSKQELKMFKEKRREKKEEKRRAWLRD